MSLLYHGDDLNALLRHLRKMPGVVGAAPLEGYVGMDGRPWFQVLFAVGAMRDAEHAVGTVRMYMTLFDAMEHVKFNTDVFAKVVEGLKPGELLADDSLESANRIITEVTDRIVR